jgi:hypothetical protein
VRPQTAQPALGLSRSCLRSFAAPGRCHERLDGDRTGWRAQRDPFGILTRQTVQNESGIYSQPRTLVGGGSGAVADS